MEVTNWHPYRFTTMKEIFELIFYLRSVYATRLPLSIDQYRSGSVSFSIKHFLPSLYHSIMNLSLIVSVVMIILVPNDIINLGHIERMFNVKRLDTLYWFLIVLMVLFEANWFYDIHSVISYNDSLNQFFLYLIDYDFDRLSPSLRQSLIKHFVRKSYLFGSIFRLIYYGNLINSIYLVWKLFLNWNRKNSWHIFSQTILAILSIHYIRIALGFLFILLNSYLFILKFLILKFNHLIKMKIEMKFRSSQTYFVSRLFRKEYRETLVEIKRFDVTVRYYLSLLIIMTIGTIIFIVAFAKFQTNQNFIFITVSICITLFIVLMQFIFQQITHFPDSNSELFKMLVNRSARCQRNQFNQNSVWKHSCHKMMSIRANLFLQLVQECPIGFYCGPFFFDKSTYIEIIIMCVVFCLLFYKKILI